MIYTSYYSGRIKGEVISISIYPPRKFQGQHLVIFAPTSRLLNWWKHSSQDVKAQEEYAKIFSQILQDRKKQIDDWVQKELEEPHIDKTLCCYEKTGLFCHRHQVAKEIIIPYLSYFWGGEIGGGVSDEILTPR